MRDTPTRLREAAERLLAARPAGRVSLRDITEAAGANVASVGYHFGSKDALLDEVVRAALTDVFAQQRDQLAGLADDARLDDVVRAWVLPAFTLHAADPAQQRRRQILQNTLATPSPAVAALLAEMAAPVQQHLIDRIARHVPDVPVAELWFRHTAVLAALAALGGGTFSALLINTDPDELADHLVTWIVGGLTAGPTTRQNSAPTAERDPGPAAERDPGPTVERDPAPAAGRDPAPAAGRDPGPAAGRDPGPTVERDPGPAAGRDPGPTAERDGGPTAERDGGPHAERDGGPTAERDG